MKNVRLLAKWTIVGLILLGILYNFLLPFTPVWFDIVAWGAIAVAFLAALLKYQVDKKGKQKGAESEQ
jgi:membrane protein implicated in regulation of membrane protease activity